ncbi:MAG: hypothetical protein HQL21_06205 [Candidatus Omnitrophica bacterium]|nr:hypothetical protein [Candidatus Omnitrophota bacterium]
MTKYFLITLFSLSMISSAAFAGTPKIITLKDGSVIHGQVLGIENSTYTIESPLAGTMHIAEDQIISISSPNQGVVPAPVSAASNASPSMPKDDISAVQNRILANPDAMSDIQALIADPEVMALMSDPAFMQAVQSRDPATIQANPRTQELMENPKIKALIEKLQAQEQN